MSSVSGFFHLLLGLVVSGFWPPLIYTLLDSSFRLASSVSLLVFAFPCLWLMSSFGLLWSLLWS